MTGNEEARQVDIRQILVTTDHLCCIEDRKAVVIGKVNHVAAGMGTNIVHILLDRQAITADMGNEMFLAHIILPDAHRCGTPDIAVVGLYKIAHHFIGQGITVRKTLGLGITGVIAEQAFVRTNKDVALTGFAQGETDHALQQTIPTHRAEAALVRIVARDTGRRSQPDAPLLVRHHGKHPVIAQMTVYRVLLCGLIVPQRMRFGIIDRETSGIGRDV